MYRCVPFVHTSHCTHSLYQHRWLKVSTWLCASKNSRFISSLSRDVSCSEQNTQHFILYFFLFQVWNVANIQNFLRWITWTRVWRIFWSRTSHKNMKYSRYLPWYCRCTQQASSIHLLALDVYSRFLQFWATSKAFRWWCCHSSGPWCRPCLPRLTAYRSSARMSIILGIFCVFMRGYQTLPASAVNSFFFGMFQPCTTLSCSDCFAKFVQLDDCMRFRLPKRCAFLLCTPKMDPIMSALKLLPSCFVAKFSGFYEITTMVFFFGASWEQWREEHCVSGFRTFSPSCDESVIQYGCQYEMNILDGIQTPSNCEVRRRGPASPAESFLLLCGWMARKVHYFSRWSWANLCQWNCPSISFGISWWALDLWICN